MSGAGLRLGGPETTINYETHLLQDGIKYDEDSMTPETTRRLLYGGAVALRLALFTLFPSLSILLGNRVEVSTPITSFRRCMFVIHKVEATLTVYSTGRTVPLSKQCLSIRWGHMSSSSSTPPNILPPARLPYPATTHTSCLHCRRHSHSAGAGKDSRVEYFNNFTFVHVFTKRISMDE